MGSILAEVGGCALYLAIVGALASIGPSVRYARKSIHRKRKS